VSAESQTYCVYCGSPITEATSSSTACRPCDSVLKVKRELSDAGAAPRCPWCDSTDARPILYGAPSDTLWKECASRNAVWGGCSVDGNEPQWSCRNCHRNWGRSLEPKSSYCNLCGRPSSQTWCHDCIRQNAEESARVFSEAVVACDRLQSQRDEIGVALLGFALILTWNQNAPVLR
jgi:hypothetical protein